MPFTGVKRLRKTCRSGNREMETDLCKPQNFNPKIRQNFSDFHNKLFFGLEGTQNGSGRQENAVFVHYAQKPRKAAQKLWKAIRNFFAAYCCPDGRRLRTFGIRPYGSKSCGAAVPDTREFETAGVRPAYAKRSKKFGISIT